MNLPGTSKSETNKLRVASDAEMKTKTIIRPKEQLLYLSELLNFEVTFLCFI